MDVGPFGFLLYESARAFRRAFLARNDLGTLTQAELRTLLLLSRMEGCSQTELAAALDVATASVCRILDTLEAQELVLRQPHPRDRRITCVHLGPRAGASVAASHATSRQLSAVAMRQLSPGERRHLLRLLGVVHRTLLAEAGEGAPLAGPDGADEPVP